MKINWGKIILGSVGLLFTAYAILLILLHYTGKTTNARITEYRQEYGERNETIRNQYTYVYGYEFEVNGKTYSGNGQRIGNSAFLKSDGSQKITVKYLSCCPYLNSAFESKNTTTTIIIFLGIGILFMVLSQKLVLANE